MTTAELTDSCDVAVIGAGPAGLAAAAVTAGAGLGTLLLDENPAPGGQIYRAVTSTPLTERSILGDDFWHGATLIDAARASGAQILSGTTVWSLDPDLVVGISRDGIARLVQARRVIIATGALERPFPIPGWERPGVMTVGAGQTLLKAFGLIPHGRTVIAGTGPLIWLYAAQVLRAGGGIDAILDTTPRGNGFAAIRHMPGFVLSPLWRKGLGLLREVRSKVRTLRGVTSLSADGDGALEAVTYTVGSTPPVRLEAGTLLLHQGVVPNVNLAMAAGCTHRWDAGQLCFVPVLDADGATSVPGILIAGDGAGIAGARAAEERGRLAGRAVVEGLRPLAAPSDEPIRQALARNERGRAFLDALYRPARRFRAPGDGTLVCRCEEVTAGQIRAAAALGCEGPNQMKAFLRCGMGPCQGRLCGLTVTELIAEVHGRSPADVGYFRIRPPVKPLALAELAAMPSGEAATKAVVRG
jgi:thioredoxin reductase/bacterioferritin-associated ferredoxin